MMKRRSFDGSLGEGDSTAAAAAVCRICNRDSCCCCCCCCRLWKVLFVVARICTISRYGFAVWFVGAHMVVGERRRRRGCGLLKLVATHSIDVCASWGEWRWHVSVIGRRGRRRRRGSECEHFLFKHALRRIFVVVVVVVVMVVDESNANVVASPSRTKRDLTSRRAESCSRRSTSRHKAQPRPIHVCTLYAYMSSNRRERNAPLAHVH